MEAHRHKNSPILVIKSTTWHKDSHSLFDYESSKVDSVGLQFPTTLPAICLYRKRQCTYLVI